MSCILGIDWGTRRIGIAVSDPSGTMALVLTCVEVRNEQDALQEIVKLCKEAEAGKIVVGLPLNMDGSKGEVALKVECFVDQLIAKTGLPVETWDERLSTAQVERLLLTADVSRQKRKQLRDKLAAQVILQSYLDSLCASSHPSEL